ncbi:MAG: SusC/RagA family TonB-linked outer membrane protein [Bacteroidetes bacterium MED-G20]|nr:MAG: SusC/RagA family TonB-linked outer membrane protein [Bacteroidetes bacterium MED-G20]
MYLRKNLSNLFLLSFLTFFSLIFSAQTSIVTGIVTDENKEVMPGVTVKIDGNNVGTTTNLYGKYSINVENDSARLVFSFIGYRNQAIDINGQSKIDIQLQLSTKSLDEVVVVGYGKTTVKELTGATVQVKGESVERLNIPRMDQALQGQVSGVTINTNSGSPGGSSSIRIRGLSTFGDNDPLILVDGVVYDSDGLNALNPGDIESINVLKDATAGIYGVRAANGVIIIETKKGRKGAKPRFEVGSYFGMQETTKSLDLLNAAEYALIKNEMFIRGTGSPIFNNTDLKMGTNWQDTIFQSSPIESFNLGVNGGGKNSSFSIGGNYFSQDGIVGGNKSSFERYNARVNLVNSLTEKLTLRSVFLFTHEERKALPENGIGSVLYNTINAFPTRPVRTADGNYEYLLEVSDIINPVAQIENTHNLSKVNKLVGKQEFEYKFNESLSFTNRLSYNYASVDDKSFSPLAWYGAGKYANSAINADLDPVQVEIAEDVFLERGASVYEQRATYLDLNFESFFNYSKSFNDHNIKATLGTSVFSRRGDVLNGTAFNIPNNSIDFADISANMAQSGYLNNTGSYEFEERLLSNFLRAEYGFKYKYIFSAIVRRDGSSKFGPNNRYGYFPSFSGAWIISDETFFNFKPLSFLKLRTSYGIAGNDQIANFAYRALLNGEAVYVFDDIITSGVAIGTAANPDLKWETTRQFNLGLDLQLLNVLDISANYFIKNTNDLLFSPDVSAIIGSYGPGGYPPIINAGDVSNKGFEFELAYATDPNKRLGMNVNFNFTYIDNEVKSVPDGVEFLPGAGFGVGGNTATRFEVGFPIGYFIGYQTDGIFQTQEEIESATVKQEGAQVGDLKFIDQDGDGEINFSNNTDKTMIGSPIPKFMIGSVLGFNLFGIDISTNLYAALGHKIVRNYERQQPYANQLGYVLDRWTLDNPSNENPRVTTSLNRNGVFSDYFVEDGSYLRIRNIQIGYVLPKGISEKFGSDYVRFYIAANNLFTITNYMGYDPDIGAAQGALSNGIDYGFYPQARTIMGGVNIKF